MHVTKQLIVVAASAALCVACGTRSTDEERAATARIVPPPADARLEADGAGPASDSAAAGTDPADTRGSRTADDAELTGAAAQAPTSVAGDPRRSTRSQASQESLASQPALVHHVRSARVEQAAAGASYAGSPAPDVLPPAHRTADREGYETFEDEPVRSPLEHPVSTFSIDVDTASYANVRRFLNGGSLPRADAVRTEEIINYFDYAYPAPRNGDPFAVYTEIGPSPWHPQRRLIHVGIQGMQKERSALPASNLVFLVDVSGSMRSADKLDLLKSSLKLLTQQLRDDDSVAIAVYAGAAGVVLEPTPGRERAKILAALDRLTAGGSTNGGAGIQLAYSLAEQAFMEGGVNRVILATDGDFNVGTVNHDALEELIEDERERGVALTVLGFGTGNYQDGLMQRLAQIGNGNAAYIDTLAEARKVLVEELASTLEVIAQDVKIQVEFNPAVVAEYRLIGYETRKLRREDFNNDRVDAGDIGPGHTVTALYEIALVDGGGRLLDPLRYGDAEDARAGTDDARRAGAGSEEIAFLRLRYKQPGGTASVLRESALLRAQAVDALADTSDDYRFSAAAAAFAQLLRGGRYTGSFSYADVAELARASRGPDEWGYRGEFLSLVGTAAALSGTRISQR